MHALWECPCLALRALGCRLAQQWLGWVSVSGDPVLMAAGSLQVGVCCWELLRRAGIQNGAQTRLRGSCAQQALTAGEQQGVPSA